MPRKRSNLLCPQCKRIGGFLTKRWIKKTNCIPKFEDITTIVQAWDYAATVCLRMHEVKLRFPPSDDELDKSLSKALYKEFAKIFHHKPEEITSFESRQMTRLLSEKKNRKIHPRKRKLRHSQDKQGKSFSSENQQYYWQDYDPYKEKIRIPLPCITGTVTKSSIAWLYGAVVFKLLSIIYTFFTFTEEENRRCVYVIYTVFSLYSSFFDDRQHVTFADWVKIYEDAKNHGFSAASSLNPSFSLKGDKVRLSTKHIRNKLRNIEDQILDIIYSAPQYTQWIDRISCILNKNQPLRQLFLLIFDSLEQKLNEGKFENIREYYFIKHTLSNKSIKWCGISKTDLACVTVIDERYKLYENLIYKIVVLQNLPYLHSFLPDAAIENCISSAASILRQLGFRNDFVYDKIKSNLILEGLDKTAISDIETKWKKRMNYHKYNQG